MKVVGCLFCNNQRETFFYDHHFYYSFGVIFDVEHILECGLIDCFGWFLILDNADDLLLLL